MRTRGSLTKEVIRLFSKNPELTRKRIEDDVKIVKELARIVIIIGSNNEIQAIEKPQWKMNIIAVIGPGQLEEVPFEEAILLEVGIGATRPYKDSLFQKRESIYRRKKWFSLTKNQYLSVRDIILEIMKKLAFEKIGGWKNSSRKIMIPAEFYSRKKKGAHDYQKETEVQCGTRFSVSRKDGMILSDIFTIELNFNPHIKQKMERITKYIDLVLNSNRKLKRSRYSKKEMANFTNSGTGKIAIIARAIESDSLMPHHLHSILQGNIKKRDIVENVIGHRRNFRIDEIEKAGALLEKSSVTQNYGFLLRTIGKNSKNGIVVFEIAKNKGGDSKNAEGVTTDSSPF